MWGKYSIRHTAQYPIGSTVGKEVEGVEKVQHVPGGLSDSDDDRWQQMEDIPIREFLTLETVEANFRY